MKKLLLTTLIYILLGILSSNVFGQQFLWTTNKQGLYPNSEIKVISKDDVLKKLLDYFELYKYYYDLTGFTKNGFYRETENSSWFNQNDNKDWGKFKNSISEINDLTITSMKNNTLEGTEITILVINKDNFQVIIFSNKIYKGYISTWNGTMSDDKNRFIKFYKSLVE
jgi:hypothetical protein